MPGVTKNFGLSCPRVTLPVGAILLGVAVTAVAQQPSVVMAPRPGQTHGQSPKQTPTIVQHQGEGQEQTSSFAATPTTAAALTAARKSHLATGILPPIASARITGSYYASYDWTSLPVGPIQESAAPGDHVRGLAGELSQTVYRLPGDIPKARAYQFYRKELRNKGFKIVFTCLGQAGCGAGFGDFVNAAGPVIKAKTGYVSYTPFAAIAAHRSNADSDTYVFIYTGEHDRHRLFQQIVNTPRDEKQASR